MSHEAKILADSVSPEGLRLTTFEVTFPRIVLAEFNTHRVFSRNSASSRAIPVQKMLSRVKEEPYLPTSWGKNQKGMQADEDVSEAEADRARRLWLIGRDDAVTVVNNLLDCGIHKQLTNRLLEPFMWHTVIVTATEWDNWFHLRNNAMAHPEIKRAAELMQTLFEVSTPRILRDGQWHLPLVYDEDWDLVRRHLGLQGPPPGGAHLIEHPDLMPSMVKVSCSRCARVSYLTHEGKRDIGEDLTLYDRLLQPGHMSPFEHAARPMTDYEYQRALRIEVIAADERKNLLFLHFMPEEDIEEVLAERKLKLVRSRETAFCGNFNGWVQHRKLILGEEDILGYRETA